MHPSDREDAILPAGTARSLRLEQFADAFGDPTRRAVYLHLRACGEAMTSADVAREFGLHRTAARAQLERLLGLGLLTARSGESRHRGRPVKQYLAAGEPLEFTLPERRYGQLAHLLLELLSVTTPPGALRERAAALGREQGERQAAELVGEGVRLPVKLFPSALVDWMNRSGYEARILPGEETEVAIDVVNCPYAELSRRHRETVCAFDGGVFCGMLGVAEHDHRQTRCIGSGDSSCRHLFTLWPVERPAVVVDSPAPR